VQRIKPTQLKQKVGSVNGAVMFDNNSYGFHSIGMLGHLVIEMLSSSDFHLLHLSFMCMKL
jgi:hypothetical protein